MKHVLGFWSALAAAGATLALARVTSAAPTRCYKSGTMVVFSNGMNTDLNDAVVVRELLKKRMSEAAKLRESTRFDVAYNRNEVWYAQLGQAGDQRTTEEMLLILQNATTYGTLMPQWLSDALTKVGANQLANQQIADEDMREHLSMYREMIKEGNAVAIVAHSQGAFYANLEWDILHTRAAGVVAVPPDSMRIVAVASPTNHLNGDGFCSIDGSTPNCRQRGRYTNFDSDAVITGVSILFQSTLAPNDTVSDAYNSAPQYADVPGITKCEP